MWRLIVLFLCSSTVHAQDIEVAASAFDAQGLKSKQYSTTLNQKTNFFNGENGKDTVLAITGSSKYTYLDHNDDNDYTIGKHLGGSTTLEDRSYSLSLSQGLSMRTSVNAAYGESKSPLNRIHNKSLGLSIWYLEDTLKVSYGLSEQISSPVKEDYLDVDVIRVVTPDSITTRAYSLDLMQFSSPSLILMGRIFYMTYSHRPDAMAFDSEFRKYFSSLSGALHGKLGYLDNTGEIEPVTTYGGVSSNRAEVSWHQKIYESQIASLTYRRYSEIEDPRAEVLGLNPMGSDYGQIKYVFRSVNGSWLDATDEYYLFGGLYKSSSKGRASVTGIGVKKLL